MVRLTKSNYKLIYCLFIIARLVSLPLVLRSLFWGWLTMFILDLVDYNFALRSGITFKTYQNIDKALDAISRIYLVIAVYYHHLPLSWLILALLIFRSVGDLLYYTTRRELFFLVFPNILEFFFPAYLMYLFILGGQNKYQPIILAVLLLLSLILKLVHEYSLHYRSWVDPINRRYILLHPEHQRQLT